MNGGDVALLKSISFFISFSLILVFSSYQLRVSIERSSRVRFPLFVPDLVAEWWHEDNVAPLLKIRVATDADALVGHFCTTKARKEKLCQEKLSL